MLYALVSMLYVTRIRAGAQGGNWPIGDCYLLSAIRHLANASKSGYNTLR